MKDSTRNTLGDGKIVCRTRLTILAVLILAFLGGMAALQRWGHVGAIRAYRPILIDEISSACRQLRFGDAEVIALRALRATPEYREAIQQTLRWQLGVMPELRQALSSPVHTDDPHLARP